MSIDPKTSAWWNFAFLLLSLIGAGTLNFAGVDDSIKHMIQSWAIDASAVISCANIVFHLYSTDKSGPLAK